MTGEALRTEDAGRVRTIVLTRGDAYNTIVPALRDELRTAVDEAEADPEVSVILLRAEGPAFCAGYQLDWGAEHLAYTDGWDPTVDLGDIGPFVDAFARLWYCRLPVIAAVQGWCLGGGTDLALCTDLIVAADDAVFGYPAVRGIGIPTTAMWVHRLGLTQAKRYLYTGDEIGAATAVDIGLAVEAVPAAELAERAMALAQRMALVPRNHLIMMKLACNAPLEDQGLATGRLLGTLFDGISRHTPEAQRFVRLAAEAGVRAAVRERDAPFGDYGSR